MPTYVKVFFYTLCGLVLFCLLWLGYDRLQMPRNMDWVVPITLNNTSVKEDSSVADPWLEETKKQLKENPNTNPKLITFLEGYEQFNRSGDKYIIASFDYDSIVRIGWTENSYPELQQQINKNRPALELIISSLDTAGWSIPTQNPTMNSYVMNFLKVQTMVKYLVVMGKQAEARNDIETALQCYLSSTQLGHNLMQDSPFMIQYLIGIACTQIPTKPLNYLIQSGKLSDAQLQKIAEESHRFHKSYNSGLNAARGEYSSILYTVNHLSDYRKLIEENTSRNRLTSLLVQINIFFNKGKIIREIDSMYRDFERQNKENLSVQFKQKMPKNFILRLFQPSYESMMIRRDVAKNRLALISLNSAAQLYQRKTGQYPQSLSQLVPSYLPSLPVDCFSGKDFLFKQADAAVPPVVFSVGPDQQTQDTQTIYDPTNGTISSGDIL